VIRLAPVPLYSSYHDCWRAAAALSELYPVRVA
jgi:kynureninase